MNNYTEVTFHFHIPAAGEQLTSDTAADVLSAMLADIGYESFVQQGDALAAYIPASQFDRATLDETIQAFLLPVAVTTEIKEIEGVDWNAEWEKNYFKPIVVADQCCIHSTFHTDYPQCQYDIVIDPKMAFGTGHHATTSQIIARLLDTDLQGKRVIDMGTGTGILAILARMRGASSVTAIEIDPAAEANARENMQLNGCPDIDLRLGGAERLEGCSADLFIANINRNIILNDLSRYAATLAPEAIMLLSGFYEADIPMILRKAADEGLAAGGHTVMGDNWACLTLKKAAK